jgi:hypothetical protein
VPAVVRGVLRVVRGLQIGGADVVVLPPTLARWREFLALAPASGHKFRKIEEAAVYWWERNIPRDVLVLRDERLPPSLSKRSGAES